MPPSPKLYYLRNRKRPHTNFIRAEKTDAGYFKYVVQNESDDGLGRPGEWLFETAYSHFEQQGMKVTGIRGSWTYGTNLITVNQVTNNNQITIEVAAKQTWAYARASSKGFTKVFVLDSDGAAGAYISVDVVFLQ